VLRYHPDGALMVEGYFRDGKQDSIQRTFTKEGKLIEEGLYEKGKKTGRWVSFFPTGDTLQVEQYKDTMRYVLSYYSAPKKSTVKNGNGVVEEFYATDKLLRRTINCCAEPIIPKDFPMGNM